MEAKSGAGVDVGRRLGASRRAGGRGQGRSEAESVASLEAFRRSLPQWKEKSQRQASSDVVLRPLVQCLCANQIASQALAPDFQEYGAPRLALSLRCLCSRRCAPLGLSSLSFPLTLFVRTGLRGN
jgi:hypothetical protein